MSWTYTPYAGIFWFTALVSGFCAYILARRSKIAGVFPLTLLMGGVALASMAAGLEAASIGPAQKILFVKLKYIGVVSVPTLFLIFALDYTLHGKWLTPRNLVLLSIVPVLGFLAALTNEQHQLIWRSYTISPLEPNTLIYSHGTGFYILAVYNYVLALGGMILLVRAWLRFPVSYRNQINYPLAGAAFPFIIGIIYAAGWSPFPGLDITPISFLGTCLVLLAGIFLNQLFSPVPISGDIVIENMLDGVLVLDAFNQIASINPVAERLIHSLSQNVAGQPVEHYLDFWEELSRQHPNAAEIQAEVLWKQDTPRFIDVHVSSLYDRHRHFAGRLVTLRDTTERKKIETDLARNVEELKIINRISLIITGGLDMERTLKALHEQCSRVAPSDVFYVALYNPSSSLVNIPIYFENGKYLTGISRDIRDHPGLIGSVIRARRTLYLHDGIRQITRPLGPSESGSKLAINSYIGIPLTVRDQVIGVMAIQSQRVNAYTEDHVRLLERVAVQAAIAIENARLYAEEQRLAIIDELTGVYNYRGLIELGSREVERARRFDRPLAALFFDIDDFRNFNNTYSHTAGNFVLKAVVKRCSSVLRSVDVLTRFGGDEFVALLPETNYNSAEGVARRLSQEIAAAPIKTSYGDLRITISVGVTMLTKDTPDLAALIDNANRSERQVKMKKKKTLQENLSEISR